MVVFGVWAVEIIVMADVRVYPTPAALADAAANYISRLGMQAQTHHGHFSLALSGGNTPRLTYETLAAPDYGREVDWTKTHFFWGDERCVPMTHPDSNLHMAKQALLNFLPTPVPNIHRIQGEIEPTQAAENYDKLLRDFFLRRLNLKQPRFDLVLLGIGTDAHTASLFPNSPALRETERWVVAEHVDKLDAWRVTLTPLALNAARHVLFIVTGENKAEALHNILKGERRPLLYPAQSIQPSDGDVVWMVDQAAARLLGGLA
jgi:6-phosphogluconolactonase